jgi:hypothetical protein
MKRSEVVGRLNEFRRDIDKYIYALPSTMLGVQFTEVISMSVELTRQIDMLRGALIEAMLQEGLSVHSETDCPPLSSWNHYVAGLDHDQRSKFTASKIQGCSDPEVERYLGILPPVGRSRTIASTRFSNNVLSRSLSAHKSPIMNQVAQYNAVQNHNMITPTCPPRSVDRAESSTELSPSLLTRSRLQSTPFPHLQDPRELDKWMKEFEQRLSAAESQTELLFNPRALSELP